MVRLDKLVQAVLAATLVLVALALTPWPVATDGAGQAARLPPAVGDSGATTPTAPPAGGTDGPGSTGPAREETGITEVGLLQLTALLVFFLAGSQAGRRREARAAGRGRAPERPSVEV